MGKRNNYKIINFLLWKIHHVISTSFCYLKSTYYCYITGSFRRENILEGDYIGHGEGKIVYMNICLILNGYGDTAD